MKTLATAITLALAAGAANAGVVYSESFDSGTLGTFVYNDYKTDQPSSFKWGNNEDDGLGNFTGGSGSSAISDSDAHPGAYDHAIVSPEIQLPHANITLSFLHNYQNFANIDFADVDISNDHGANWDNLFHFNEDHGTFYSAPGEAALVDLTRYANEAVQLRFHHYNNDADALDWYWQVDEIAITSSPIPAPGALGLLGAAGLVARRRRR